MIAWSVSLPNDLHSVRWFPCSFFSASTTSPGVSESVDAFVRLDLDQAREVIAYDDVVDRWFDQIKKELVSQIAADSTAGEELLDVFLVAKYLERIGDHATNLAEWVEYALTGTRSKDGHWEAPDGE